MIRVFRHWFVLPSILRMVFLTDLGAALAGAGCEWFGRAGNTAAVSLGAFHAALIVATVLSVNARLGFYRPLRVPSARQAAVRAAFSALFAAALMSVLLWLFARGADPGQMIATPSLALLAAAFALRRGSQAGAPLAGIGRRVLVLGTGPSALSVRNLPGVADAPVEVLGYYPSQVEEAHAVPAERILSARRTLLQTALELRAEEIVVALQDRRGGSLPLQELLQCRVMGIRVHDLSTHFERSRGQLRLESLRAGWLVFGDGFDQGLARRVSKRAFDIAFACGVLALAAPLMLLAMLLIVLESGAPVFYRQERTGKDGRAFNILKFRSMRSDAESDGKPRWAAPGDDRITRVGRVIRRFRIDELPQLFNILAGDMSFSGPRPERPFFVASLSRELQYYGLRHSVKPGLTGWAQVSYGYGDSVKDAAEKLQYDLFYVKNHNLFLDLLIVFKTIRVVLDGRGAH